MIMSKIYKFNKNEMDKNTKKKNHQQIKLRIIPRRNELLNLHIFCIQ